MSKKLIGSFYPSLLTMLTLQQGCWTETFILLKELLIGVFTTKKRGTCTPGTHLVTPQTER
jgi:hypothetical protein